MKIRLLIASSDTDYVDHLSRVLLETHYELFDVSVCSQKDRLEGTVKGHRIDVVLLDSEFIGQAIPSSIRLPLLLWDENAPWHPETGLKRVKKYQRISTITKNILGLYATVTSKNEGFSDLTANITAVWSPAGGSGKTTAALAFAASRVSAGKKTLYLDLQTFSCSSVYFQQGGQSISSLFEKLDSNMELLLQSILQEDSGSGIMYFCQPDNYDDISILTVDDVVTLVEGCTKGVEELVVDLSSVCSENVKVLFDMANTILLVVDGSRSGLAKWHQFQTQHSIFDSIKDKTILINNRGGNERAAMTAGVIDLPFVKSGDPISVYKTLSAHFAQ